LRKHQALARIRPTPARIEVFRLAVEPKLVKNRVHREVTVQGVAPLVGGLVTLLREPDDDINWHVLMDPKEANSARSRRDDGKQVGQVTHTPTLPLNPATLSGESREDVLRVAEDREVPLARVDLKLRAWNRLGIAACMLYRDSGVGIPVVN
jgi:hypothetical protein